MKNILIILLILFWISCCPNKPCPDCPDPIHDTIVEHDTILKPYPVHDTILKPEPYPVYIHDTITVTKDSIIHLNDCYKSAFKIDTLGNVFYNTGLDTLWYLIENQTEFDYYYKLDSFIHFRIEIEETSEDTIIPPVIFSDFEGFGINKGAYETIDNPTILTVNTLDESSIQTGSNTGSLRWCLTRNFPRVVKFSVSGIIDLQSTLMINYPYCTVLGQTSPEGITLKRYPFEIRTNNVIMQHLKIRTGNQMPGISLGDRDALRFYNASKIVVDHCSISWGCDENVSLTGSHDITISNCIIAEALRWDLSGYSYGLLANTDTKNLSLIRNLDIHNLNRNPYVDDNSTVEIINCMIYNTQKRGCDFNNAQVSMIGNVKLNGPNAGAESQYIARARDECGSCPDQSIYLQGNISPAGLINTSGHCAILNSPIVNSGTYTLISASDVEDYIIENVGAFNWSRDKNDLRYINDLINRTGTYKTSITDNDY